MKKVFEMMKCVIMCLFIFLLRVVNVKFFLDKLLKLYDFCEEIEFEVKD